MARIRGKGTRPEEQMYLLLRDALPRQMRIYRHHKKLPGKPDFYIPRLSLIVFVDGCFFHSCPRHGHLPKSNQDYWKPKLEKNERRDRANHRELRKRGLSVWRYWEHGFKSRDALKRTKARVERMILERMSERP